MKKVNNLHEDDADDPQYFVHKITHDNIALRCWVSAFRI
jgi:hypothetical protein